MSDIKDQIVYYKKDSRDMGSFLMPASIDLILSGPPYHNHVVYGQEPGQLSNLADLDSFCKSLRQVWLACSTVQKPGGILALWVHDILQSKDGYWDYQSLHDKILSSVPTPYKLQVIGIWDRYLNRNRGPLNQHKEVLGSRFQYILIFSHGKPNPRYLRSLEKWLWTPIWHKKTSPSLFGSELLYKISFFISRRLLPNHKLVTTNPLVSDKNAFDIYKTECSPEIAQRLIDDFSNPGEVILDPFAGSGTTLISARQKRRKAIGIDISQTAVAAATLKIKDIKVM